MFHKNCKICKKMQKLNNFKRLVININNENNLGLGVDVAILLYNIMGYIGDGFQKCYTVLYRVGGGRKFPIFALYNMCTIPNFLFSC